MLDPTKILRLLGGKGAYRRFVLDGLGEGHNEGYYKVEDQRFLGAEGFGEKIQQEIGNEEKPAVKRPMGTVIKELSERLGIESKVLRGPDRSWAVSKSRTLIAYVLVRRVGYGLGEVAAYLGRDMATVGTLVARFYKRMQLDRKLLRQIERLSKIVEI